MKKLQVSNLLLAVIFISISTFAQISSERNCSNFSGLTQYEGRYKKNDFSLATIKIIENKLILRPIFWRTEQPLREKIKDEFVNEERINRQITFQRNEKGCVQSISLSGFGGDDGNYQFYEGELTPIELLFNGKPQIAVEKMIQNNPNGFSEIIGVAGKFLRNFPSKKLDAVKFLEILAEYFPNNSLVFAVLGNAQIFAENRLAAKTSFLKAYSLDSKNEAAIRGLRRLEALPANLQTKSDGWKVSFSLDDVFKKPTKDEIAQVEADWKQRNLLPKDVKEVFQGKIDLGNSQATVHIISHSVHSDKHFGAIIVPDGINTKSPVILDLKGVSWDYFPLELNSIISPKILGTEQNKFIYVVPSFRGEILRFNGVEYHSEGDRTDSWDGATDDALALLNVALSLIPQADETKICAFGMSRGGSVALLSGIRNQKIKQVLDWTGPVDWFDLMANQGWTQKETITEGLLNKSAPNEEGGQFIERHLLKAIQGKWNLAQVRRSILAGSPIYFAGHLPQLQIHYGIEDEIVPIKNGEALVQKMKESGRTASNFSSFFHPNSGHDLNQRVAFAESKKFLLQLLK